MHHEYDQRVSLHFHVFVRDWDHRHSTGWNLLIKNVKVREKNRDWIETWNFMPYSYGTL